MAAILYRYQGQVYANITNRCNCRCTFCIRFLHPGVGDAETLWHDENPTKQQVLEAFQKFNFSGYQEIVFCGYGEPTCALDILLDAAAYARKEHGLRVRLNTNGLGSAENGRDIVPELQGVVDTVSISLNAPDEKGYLAVTRPQISDAFAQMKRFAVRCRDEGLDVRWTVVDVLSADEIARCQTLADETGIPLRVRKFG